jgi:serine/threonine-protein kinase RsbW
MKSLVKHRKKKNVHLQRRTVFKMVCKSYPKEVACIEKFLHKVRDTRLHIDDGSMHRLLVSCTEAMNNAIIHGNNSDPEKEVMVTCIIERRFLIIRVKDEGKGFDLESLRDPRDEKNLLKENGRGVFLMRTLMDDVKFKKLKSGHVVEMKLKLHRMN